VAVLTANRATNVLIYRYIVRRANRGKATAFACIVPTVALAGGVACAGANRATVQAPRYVVTGEPIDLGIRGARFCVAVDPADRQGVWWWEPGATGCSSRSTGPAVFRAEAAAVSTSGNAIDARFGVQLITRPGFPGPDYKEVRLLIEAGRFRVPATGADVLTVRRTDLELPERVR